MIDEEAVRRRLKIACQGNIAEWARMRGFTRQEVHRAIYGKRRLTNKILKALKLKRVEKYIKDNEVTE